MYKRGWPGQEHVANLSENGRKAMICSVYVIVIITDIYHIIFIILFVYKLTAHIPGWS